MGSPAPTPAPHTPVMYLAAGGMANFSASCAKLLMKSGYDPASFGSHSYVQALTERAKQRVAYYKKLKSEGNPTTDEFRPPEADFHLAECEAVPLATDPNRPISQMPARAARGPSTVPGTEAHEALRSIANGGKAGASAQADVAARSGEKPQLTKNDKAPVRSKAELAKEAAQRAKVDEAIGGQNRAGGNRSESPTRSKGKGTKAIQGNTVGECIDNFVKQSLADMDSNKSNSANADEGAADGGEGGGGSDKDGGHKVVGAGRSPAQPVPRPTVSDPKLHNLVRDLYKGANTPHPIGTGSTADAIRHEARTGEPVGGKFHAQKGTEYARALERWLAKNPDAPATDRAAAKAIADDLNRALEGK